jgi:hypothetical protein
VKGPFDLFKFYSFNRTQIGNLPGPSDSLSILSLFTASVTYLAFC